MYGKHESTIRRWAEKGKLNGDLKNNEFNSPEYCFSVDALDPPQQQKYFDQLKASLPTPPAGLLPERKGGKPLDHYSAEEQLEIAWWLKTVKEWQRYRSKYPGRKAEADDKFVALCAKTDPEHPISIDILYRKWRAVREDDLDGLIDKRGKARKGKSSMDVDSKMTGLKGEFTLTIKQVYTRFWEIFEDMKNGNDTRVQIIAKLADPDAEGGQQERYSTDNCWFNDLPFVGAEMGALVEKEFTGGFTPSDMVNLDKIAV